MFTLRDSILIHAPIERLFALSTSLAIVERELGMRPVASHTSEQKARTTGQVTAGDTVRWQGMQLGFPNHHVSLISADTWQPPLFFQDRRIAGRFRSFEHDHRFTQQPGGSVLLADEVRFTMPFGWPGRLVGRTVLIPHIRRLLRRRFRLLKHLAESGEWRQYIPE